MLRVSTHSTTYQQAAIELVQIFRTNLVLDAATETADNGLLKLPPGACYENDLAWIIHDFASKKRKGALKD
jgi:hypothetical protein